MLNDDERKKLTVQLKRIEGQVRGLTRMIEEGQYCIDVMHQVAAAQGIACRGLQKLLSRHLDTCVRSAMDSKDKARRDRVLEETRRGLRPLWARCTFSKRK
ncbi:MAG: metal-sensitive transcriptional regulator [Planctomycetota bacterium]